jgi:hypothetical protein
MGQGRFPSGRGPFRRAHFSPWRLGKEKLFISRAPE